jgi:hypothetical protein
LEKGSSGIYILQSNHARLSDIRGVDFRGPSPRGQFVQFDQCVDPVLDTFTVQNPGQTAWTEDVVSSYGSTDPIIRNGYIEGVNSPTGMGVMIENGNGGHGGLIENVDVRFWVNGAFGAADGSRDVTFRNVRALDGLAIGSVSDNANRVGADGAPIPTLEQWAGDNWRGGPTSGQEAFLVFNAATASIVFDHAGFANLPRAGRIAWDTRLMSTSSFYPAEDTLRQIGVSTTLGG